jgi:hypothetical protein
VCNIESFLSLRVDVSYCFASPTKEMPGKCFKIRWVVVPSISCFALLTVILNFISFYMHSNGGVF